MKRALSIFVSTAVAIAAACGDGPAALADLDRTGRDASPPRRDAATSGGATPDAAELDAESSSSSSSSSSSGSLDDAGEVLPGLCRVADAYGISLPVPGLTSVQNALAFTITPDERVVAWLEAGDAGALHLLVASRATESVAFDPAEAVSVTGGAYPGAQGLALSADALHLVLVRADGAGLGEMTRAARSAAFAGAVDPLPYAAIEPGLGAAAVPLAAPTFGMQDRMLAIARVRPDAPAYSVLVAERAQVGDAWPLPSPRTEGVLAVAFAGSSQPKTVTGISVDGLTFFVRNDVTGELFAVNRPNLGATFESEYRRPVAAASAAMPSADCARLYVLEAGAIFVRDRNVE